MGHCYWCTDCSALFECGSEHNQHLVYEVGGADVNQTIVALDEMINFGLKRIEGREDEVKQATEVKEDIDGIRDTLVDNSKKRIERIAQDLRVAMEYSTGQLLKEANKKMGDMELKCQSVITTSRAKTETIKGFIQEAALMIPDEEGKVDPKQLAKMYGYFKTVQKMESEAKPRLNYVDFNVIYPDSYRRKKECQDLADSVSGRIEAGSSRQSLVQNDVPDQTKSTDVVSCEAKELKKPKRKVSRDMLRN